MSSRKAQHVVPRDGRWAVRGAGNAKATQTFETQGEAVELARRIARNQKTELVIHDRDGRIRGRSSYGIDPLPPRDQR